MRKGCFEVGVVIQERHGSTIGALQETGSGFNAPGSVNASPRTGEWIARNWSWLSLAPSSDPSLRRTRSKVEETRQTQVRVSSECQPARVTCCR